MAESNPKFEIPAPAAGHQMSRSPRRPPRPTPPAPPAAPGPSQPMAAPAAAGEEAEQEFEICNCDGFVYKRPRGLYPDVAPPSAPAAGPRNRRRALLRLRGKRLRELARWEALEGRLLAPLPAPRQPPTPASPPLPAASSSSEAWASVLDDRLAELEMQEAVLKRVSALCVEVDALCCLYEADVTDAIAALPVWGDPKELVKTLQSPDCQTVPDTSDLDFRIDFQNEGNGGFQRLDERQGKRATKVGEYDGRQETAALSSTPVQMIKNSDKPPNQCKRCFQFGHIENTCREIPPEQGDELPPLFLSENRKRNGIASPSGSSSVAAQPPEKSKRKKASGSTSTSSGARSLLSPRSTTKRKGASTPTSLRPDTFCSSGPTTRRRAEAAKNVLT